MTSHATPSAARRGPVLILQGLAVLGMVGLAALAAFRLAVTVHQEWDSSQAWAAAGVFFGTLVLGSAMKALAALGGLTWLLWWRPRVGLQVVVAVAAVGLVGTAVVVLDQVSGPGGWTPWEAAAYGGTCSVALGLGAWGLASS